MSETKQVYAAFVKAQAAFGPALKTSTNPHFRSKYAALDACIEAVIDALNANGIALVQKTHKDDTGVTVETVFLHSSGESFSGGELHVPAAKNDPQGYGSALSYARRYSLMSACGIAATDDDGEAASGRPQQQAPSPQVKPQIAAATLTAVKNFLKDAQAKPIVERGLAHFKCATPEALTEEAGQAIIKKVAAEIVTK